MTATLRRATGEAATFTGDKAIVGRLALSPTISIPSLTTVNALSITPSVSAAASELATSGFRTLDILATFTGANDTGTHSGVYSTVDFAGSGIVTHHHALLARLDNTSTGTTADGWGVRSQVTLGSTGAYTAARAYGAIAPDFSGAGTVGTYLGLEVEAAAVGSATVADFIGIKIAQPAGASNENIALLVGGYVNSTTAGLVVNMSGGVQAVRLEGTGASNGILFGGDANLYRYAANQLATDDYFLALGGMQINGVGGQAFQAFGASGYFTGTFKGHADAGASYGPVIDAGTNSSDTALLVRDQTGGTTYFTIRGDGAITVGKSGGALGFFGLSPVARPVLATGAGKIVDDVITVLQTLGLVSQT